MLPKTKGLSSHPRRSRSRSRSRRGRRFGQDQATVSPEGCLHAGLPRLARMRATNYGLSRGLAVALVRPPRRRRLEDSGMATAPPMASLTCVLRETVTRKGFLQGPTLSEEVLCRAEKCSSWEQFISAVLPYSSPVRKPCGTGKSSCRKYSTLRSTLATQRASLGSSSAALATQTADWLLMPQMQMDFAAGTEWPAPDFGGVPRGAGWSTFFENMLPSAQPVFSGCQATSRRSSTSFCRQK